MAERGLTPTECKLFGVLCDGKPHMQKEFLLALKGDEEDRLNGELLNCLNVHLNSMRKKLRPQGQDISTEKVNNNTFYRLVRLIGSSYR